MSAQIADKAKDIQQMMSSKYVVYFIIKTKTSINTRFKLPSFGLM